MTSNIKEIIVNEKNKIREYLHVNIDYLIKHFNNSKKEEFFEEVQKELSINIRKLKSWYYEERLPALNNRDLFKLTKAYHINFSDFVTKKINSQYFIKSNIPKKTPEEIAKKNIFYLLIKHGIETPEKFENYFESNFSIYYYNSIRVKGRHSKSISWNFLIASAHYFDVSITDLLKEE